MENFTDNLKAQYNYAVYMVDEERDLELTVKDKLNASDATLTIKLLPYSVALVTLEK